MEGIKDSLFKFLRLDNLMDNLTGYVEARVELLKIEIREDIARVLAKAIVVIMVAVLAMIFLLFLSIVILSLRSGCTFKKTLNSMREAFILGVATNNSATCMPAMVDGLVGHLKFGRSRVELLVPLIIFGPVHK